MNATTSQKGVSLVETLVALAVLGFLIGSLLVLIGQNSRFASSMRDKTMASVAVDNLMVEALVLSEALEVGEVRGDTMIAERTLSYRRVTTETGVDDVLRIDIEVLDSATGQILAGTTSMRRAR